MPITGFSYDSDAGGVGFITSPRSLVSAGSAIAESIGVSGTHFRVETGFELSDSVVLMNFPTAGGVFTDVALGQIGTATGDLFEVRNSQIITRSTADRINHRLGSLDNVIFITDGSVRLFIFTMGDMRNVAFNGIYTHQIADLWDQFFNVSYIDTYIGMLNWDSGRVDRFGISVPSTVSGFTSWIGGSIGDPAPSINNQFWDWNPGDIDVSAFAHQFTEHRNFVGYTASYKFIDTDGNIDDLLLIYRDNRGGSTAEIGRWVTNSDGILEGTVDSQDLAVGPSGDRPTLYILNQQSTRSDGGPISTGLSEPTTTFPYTMDSVAFSLEIRSYLHLSKELITSISGQQGRLSANQTVEVYADNLLLIDEGVTETNISTVGGYSGIAYSGNTYTLSGSLTISQVYDWAKRNWRNNDGISVPTKNGFVADFGSDAITITAPGNLPTNTAKYTQFTTTGLVTLAAAGNFSTGAAGVIPAAGDGVEIVGNSNLTGWIFELGAEINGAGIVTVSPGQSANITAGAGVSISEPVSQITLTNIPNVAGAVVGVIDLTTESSSFPTIASGTVTIPTNPDRNYFIAVDAPGWIRQSFTLAGSAGTFALDWTGRDFRTLYEQGNALYTGISISYTPGPTLFQATVDDSEIDLDFATVFRRIEDLLAVEAAIFFSNPPVPQVIQPGAGVSRNYLVFPYDAAADVPNPVVVLPHPDNTEDPRFTDFVAIWPGAADPFYSNVLTNTDTGRRIRIQTEALGGAVAVSGGGFDLSDRTRLTEVWRKQALDPAAPVTRVEAGDAVTETFGATTITHESNGTNTVTSTRSP